MVWKYMSQKNYENGPFHCYFVYAKQIEPNSKFGFATTVGEAIQRNL